MKTEKIYTQHEENKEWLNNILFYKDELKVMQNRLQEIASKNTAKELLKEVEHFQNQLIVQRENCDVIQHEINISNDIINNEIKKNTTAIEHRSISDHSSVRDNIGSFEKNFKELKKEFNLFLSKWM